MGAPIIDHRFDGAERKCTPPLVRMHSDALPLAVLQASASCAQRSGALGTYAAMWSICVTLPLLTPGRWTYHR